MHLTTQNYNQHQARRQDFCWGGGGGGGRMSASGVKCLAPQARARKGVWGYCPPEDFEKNGLSEAAFRAF